MLQPLQNAGKIFQMYQSTINMNICVLLPITYQVCQVYIVFIVPRLFEEKWRDTVFGFRGAWRVVRGSKFLVDTLSP